MSRRVVRGVRFLRFQATVLGLAIVMVAAFAAPALGAVDAYGQDPNRLVPFRDSINATYTSGDVWDVWVCSVQGGTLVLDPGQIATDLTANVAPYFAWLSGGRYTPTFHTGGTVTSADPVESVPLVPGCEQDVAAASTAQPNAVLIIANGTSTSGMMGWGTDGTVCGGADGSVSHCATTYPDNNRSVALDARAVTTVAPYVSAGWDVVAHEIGHALSWAHSYSGATADSSGGVWEYDNAVDVMSGQPWGSPIGTTGYNRYAAGWIDPGEIGVYTSGTQSFSLVPTGARGIGMVVIPQGVDGYFYELDYRPAVSWDSTLVAAGVEVYLIDSRASACTQGWLPAGTPCLGPQTRISQNPAVEGAAHVYAVGSSFGLGNLTVTVAAGDAGGVTVEISDGQVTTVAHGTFVDDDGDIHESNIEAIAARGITKGCNAQGDRFCPAQEVSRAEMAVFLVRAIGEEANLPGYLDAFPDVPADAWYTPYVERLAQLGVTSGYTDGTFGPDLPVSRAEMAAFVTRAFGTDTTTHVYSGVFADAPADAWYVAAAETMFDSGLTAGCSAEPRLYCPDAAVPRDQMASFLARALGLSS
ncbi:MAG TPA: hypothetical protein ENH00_10580 [Actinobacteria bacterium]|nr:hypothetical protein [Actinomycetota bacterium]